MKKNGKKSGFTTFILLALTVFVAIISVAYAVMRAINDHSYEERWSDYDECGDI